MLINYQDLSATQFSERLLIYLPFQETVREITLATPHL